MNTASLPPAIADLGVGIAKHVVNALEPRQNIAKSTDLITLVHYPQIGEIIGVSKQQQEASALNKPNNLVFAKGVDAHQQLIDIIAMEIH